MASTSSPSQGCTAREFQAALDDVAATMDRLLAAEVLPAAVTPPWLRRAVTAYPQHGGKRLRPALLLWCCGLAGGDPARAAHAALAVELYHNWTLIHDDVIDGDATRRGRPTCHWQLRKVAGQGVDALAAAKFGRDQAVLAGDILHGWSLACLTRAAADGVSPELTLALVARLSGRVTPALISGEAQDVALALQPPRQAGQVLTMLTLKTAVLLAFAAQSGYMIGAGTCDGADPGVRRIGRFATAAGLAFQLQDDLLGIYGEEAELGKPVGADLREGKHTWLYLQALARLEPTERRQLQRLHGRQDLTRRELETAREIMTRCGAAAATRHLAGQYVRTAQRALRCFPPSPYRDRLQAWTAFVTTRNR